VTQMLAVGGKDKMEALSKVLELLQSDGGKETDMKMLAELFGVEEKELVAKVKEREGMSAVRAAVEALEDSDEKKKLMAALGGGKGDEEEKTKTKTKEKALPVEVREALVELLAGKEPDPAPEPSLDADVIKAAVVEALKPLEDRVAALEGGPGMDDMVKEIKEIFDQYKPKDPQPPSTTNPPLEGGVEEFIARLQKDLGLTPAGKHPFSGFASGPGAQEGG
jgi:hypothetical protein